MRERNPFLLRTTERIKSDDEFIKLFSPKVLECIEHEISGYSLWNQFFRFQSSPGGGKTSLLRLFRPTVLNRISEIFSNSIESTEDINLLHRKLREFGAFGSDSQIQILSVYISCSSDYMDIVNLSLPQQQIDRLFLALINVRIIVAALRTILEYIKLQKGDFDYEKELQAIRIEPSLISSFPSNFPLNCNGYELYKWCSKIERDIYNQIDGFESKEIVETAGHDSLYALQLFTIEQVKYDGGFEIPKNFTIMFDDVQNLAIEQNKLLINDIVRKRPPIGVWLAERLELLTLEQFWSNNATRGGRDYVKVINLERMFKKGNQFKNFTLSIAQKRVDRARDSSINSFPGSLLEEIDINEDVLLIYKNDLINRIRNKSSIENNFEEWVKSVLNNTSLSLLQVIEELITIQLLVERLEKKGQKALFPVNYKIEEFEIKKQNVQSWIPSFLSKKELKLPNYFGYNSIVEISHSNIEQFLSFSGRLFEDIISAKVSNEDNRLKPEIQEKILLKECESRWNDINSLATGKEIQRFLEATARFCQREDDKPGYPYSGVTGFGLDSRDRQKLTDAKYLINSPFYKDISRVLTICIANNLIEIVNNVKQGDKHDPPKTVFYLNRWICVKFGLSLKFGGWRKLNLETLGRWHLRGFKKGDSEVIGETSNLYDI